MHYWDPIVFPGVYGYFRGGPTPFNTGTHGPAHWHNFFGNVSLSPNGIGNPNAATTCTGGFKGNFWVPNLLGYNATYSDGYMLVARTASYYLNAPLPAGFAFISRTVTWDCGIGTPKTDVPHACPTGGPQAVVQFRPAAELRVRVTFATDARMFKVFSVGGVTIAAQNPDGTWKAVCNDSGNVRCEDERSFHMDVLAP